MRNPENPPPAQLAELMRKEGEYFKEFIELSILNANLVKAASVNMVTNDDGSVVITEITRWAGQPPRA